MLRQPKRVDWRGEDPQASIAGAAHSNCSEMKGRKAEEARVSNLRECSAGLKANTGRVRLAQACQAHKAAAAWAAWEENTGPASKGCRPATHGSASGVWRNSGRRPLSKTVGTRGRRGRWSAGGSALSCRPAWLHVRGERRGKRGQ